MYQKRINRILTIVIPLFFLVSACKILDPEKLIDGQYYQFAINSRTIIDDIESNKVELFISYGVFDNSPSPSEEIVYWDIKSYFVVAEYSHLYVWNEPINDWLIYKLSLTYNCESIDLGPTNWQAAYYKIEQGYWLESDIGINPSDNTVSIFTREYSPHRTNLNPILTENAITPAEIIGIAESHGGHDVRISVDDNCEIQLLLNPKHDDYSGWQISYINAADEKLLIYFQIDPQSGEIVKTNN